ncbi:MAG: RNase adapter RapZ [Paracoccaceae bacterium]
MSASDLPQNRLVLVTGPSGAGRTTAIKVLEDLDFEAIDNLPLGFWSRLLDGPMPNRPLALGVDTRNRDFSVTSLLEHVDALSKRPTLDVNLLYLDCRRDILLRRFSETRRRHPLAPAESTEKGVQRELDLLWPIRDHADTLIDTSDLNVHQLRAEIERWFAPDGARPLAVSMVSFAFKRGVPRATDMLFDCRFLTNPYWDADLRDKDGRSEDVQNYVRSDTRFQPFFDRVLDMTRLLLPAYVEEGKSHFSIAFGCTGGRHRSVTLAESLAKALAEDGLQVSIRHRELEQSQYG